MSLVRLTQNCREYTAAPVNLQMPPWLLAGEHIPFISMTCAYLAVNTAKPRVVKLQEFFTDSAGSSKFRLPSGSASA
jgi:hypothetical protein